MSIQDESIKKFKFINCACCGNKIEIMDPGYNKYGPEAQMWKDGIVLKGSANYGSVHDGDLYYVGICDMCVAKNLDNGRIIYHDSYLFPIENDRIEKYQKIRNRNNNLNDLV